MVAPCEYIEGAKKGSISVPYVISNNRMSGFIHRIGSGNGSDFDISGRHAATATSCS